MCLGYTLSMIYAKGLNIDLTEEHQKLDSMAIKQKTTTKSCKRQMSLRALLLIKKLLKLPKNQFWFLRQPGSMRISVTKLCNYKMLS